MKKCFYLANLAMPARITNYIITFLLLLFVLSFNSCKKDIVLPSPHLELKTDFKIDKVTYNNFISTINLNSLGLLKPKLGTNYNKKLLSINENNALGNLSIYTDSIKRIINKNDTSYVFQMALSSPRAIYLEILQ